MKKITKLRKKNYLATINNSIDSIMFRNLWIKDGDTEIDVLENGKLSCAVYVTSILVLYGLIDGLHATVKKTIECLEKFGWEKIKRSEIEPGDIIVWNKRIDKNGKRHGHIGFFIGNDSAVSNSMESKKIVQHGWDYGGKRKIVAVWRWKKW